MTVRRRAGSPALLSLLLLALSPPAIAGASVASPEARLQVELARVLRQVGNAPAAETALARALEIDPACAPAWLERGFLAEESGSFSRARREGEADGFGGVGGMGFKVLGCRNARQRAC